jgi:hypothetical protein
MTIDLDGACKVFFICFVWQMSVSTKTSILGYFERSFK